MHQLPKYLLRQETVGNEAHGGRFEKMSVSDNPSMNQPIHQRNPQRPWNSKAFLSQPNEFLLGYGQSCLVASYSAAGLSRRRESHLELVSDDPRLR